MDRGSVPDLGRVAPILPGCSYKPIPGCLLPDALRTDPADCIRYRAFLVTAGSGARDAAPVEIARAADHVRSTAPSCRPHDPAAQVYAGGYQQARAEDAPELQ